MKRLALSVVALVALTAAPATAQTVTSKDTYEGGSPAQNITSGTVSFSGSGKVTYRVKFETLDKSKTAMCTKFTQPTGLALVCVKWSRSLDAPKIVPHYSTATSYERLPTTGIRSFWNFDSDIISLTLDGLPQISESRADVLVFSLVPGAQEGSPAGNDLFVKGLRRG